MATTSKIEMKQETIGSLSRYIDYIRTNYTEDIVLFRGQREDKPLLPKIARIHTRENVLELLDEFKRKSIRLNAIFEDEEESGAR
jgi:hypothetical protein